MLTAKKARILADKGKFLLMKKQLKEVVEYINTCTKQGGYRIEYYESLEDGVLEELHRLGYSVKTIKKNDRFYYYLINW